MRRGWKKSWRLGSVMCAAVTIAFTANDAALVAKPQRHSEMTLAGLRPGSSKLSPGRKFPGFDFPTVDSTGYQWLNHCDGRVLTVEIDEYRTVGSITVSTSTLGPIFGDCVSQDESHLRASIKTGRGLQLGDSCKHVTELYGEPESRGPSVRGARKLELLFYSFDWAGENVPQSMEVSCDRATGHVVEIMLAFSSL